MSNTSSCIKQIAIEVYKIIHNLSPSFIPEKKIHISELNYGTRGNKNNLKIDHHNTQAYGTQSFRHMGAKILTYQGGDYSAAIQNAYQNMVWYTLWL